jgi:hypothetical protein
MLTEKRGPRWEREPTDCGSCRPKYLRPLFSTSPPADSNGIRGRAPARPTYLGGRGDLKGERARQG